MGPTAGFSVGSGLSDRLLVSYCEPMEKVLDSYWIPLAGEESLYLHFGIDVTEYASEQQFPQIKGNNADLKSSV